MSISDLQRVADMQPDQYLKSNGTVEKRCWIGNLLRKFNITYFSCVKNCLVEDLAKAQKALEANMQSVLQEKKLSVNEHNNLIQKVTDKFNAIAAKAKQNGSVHIDAGPYLRTYSQSPRGGRGSGNSTTAAPTPTRGRGRGRTPGASRSVDPELLRTSVITRSNRESKKPDRYS